MNLPIVLNPLASQDVEEAAIWYDGKADSATRFVGWIEQVLDGISQMPEMHALVYRDVRRARVLKTPYNLYYRVLTDRVEVLAVVHGRRHPSAWQSRA